MHDELVGSGRLFLPMLSELSQFTLTPTSLNEMGPGFHEETLAKIIGVRDELVSHCEDFRTSG